MTVSAWRTRAALGLPPGLLPLGAYLGIGVLLGPQVLNVVTEDVGAHLDAVVSIALGFIGALVGTWLARLIGLPELLTISIRGTRFPILWSIIGSAVFVAVISLITRSRR